MMKRPSIRTALPTSLALLLGGSLLVFEAATGPSIRSGAGASHHGVSAGTEEMVRPIALRSRATDDREEVVVAVPPSDDEGDALPSGQALLDYVESLKPSVVSVVATDRDGVDVAAGSGFIVGANLVITNHQVVARGLRARIILKDQTEVPARAVAAHDTRVNLTLLEVAFDDETPQPLRQPRALAAADPRETQEVLLITNPIGREHTVALGTVHGTEERPDLPPIVRIKTNYATASTGSPVFNGRGEVIGVAAFGVVDGASQKFTIPASAVRDLLASADDTVPVSLTDYYSSMAGTLIASGEGAGAQRVRPEDVKIEATIVTQPDGSVLIDDRYIVRGSGTREDPYRVTWDLLVSASRVYQPREGLDRLPQRITFLDNKWVTLSGFVAFPLMTQESDELLLMLNQWDGCCIGVPPTPYDAIEVTLRNKVPGEAGINIFNYGSVTGLFKVDPYVVNKWLVGLYLMEDAVLRLEM